MSTTLTDAGQVCNYINTKLVEMDFRGEPQSFLPAPDFDVITAEDVVRAVIWKDQESYLGEQERENLVRRILKEGRKMFATCVYGGLPMTCLEGLFQDGLSDGKFPFKIENCPGQKNNQRFRSSFINNQKTFNVAFFRLSVEQTLDRNISKPISYDESDEALLGEGAFGQVYEISIHPSQRSFSSGADRKGHFAMKVTQHKGTREVSFHRAMADLSHHHLLKCLASFVFSSKYHMIYEKADCNIEVFMRKNPNPRSLANLTTDDLAQQLFGLADALCFIHNQGSPDSTPSTNLLGVPQVSARKTGYIHDIKPENLLMFIYNQPGKKSYWIRLSDFSCAKVVDILTTVSGKNRHSYKTVSKSGTPVYRAPEATPEGGQTSRPYDLWSLGCVYLELLVWFLDGYDALKQFREEREGLVSPNTFEDEGFYYTPTEGEPFRLRDVVTEKIDSVSNRTEGHLKTIADMIPQLLKIDPEKRPNAEQLVKKLQNIDNGARPPIEVSHSNHDYTSSTNSLPLPTYTSDSDSDSSFGDMVRVQHPTEE